MGLSSSLSGYLAPVRYTSRGYTYTTSPAHLTMDMVHLALEMDPPAWHSHQRFSCDSHLQDRLDEGGGERCLSARRSPDSPASTGTFCLEVIKSQEES